MRRLLRANFARLIKDKVFLSGVATMILFGLYWVLRESINRSVESVQPLLFYHVLLLPFALACACALFIGTDYSDGTLRGKIVVGHARKDIYVANLITCAAAGGAMEAAGTLAAAVPGIALCGLAPGAATQILCLATLCFLNMLAIASVCTLAGMLIQSKSSAAVTVLIGLVAMFGLAVALNMRLEQPELLLDAAPNPAYMTGVPRRVSEFLFDALPAGQSISLFQMKAPAPVRMALCSVGIILLSTLTGVMVFRKRDIR